MVALIPNVSGQDVADACGRSADTTFVDGMGALAASAARDAASSYTRGKGFEDPTQMPASLRHVILFRAVRIAQNMAQLQSESRDGVSMSYGQGGQGFLLQEILALDEYRRKTASLPAWST